MLAHPVVPQSSRFAGAHVLVEARGQEVVGRSDGALEATQHHFVEDRPGYRAPVAVAGFALAHFVLPCCQFRLTGRFRVSIGFGRKILINVGASLAVTLFTPAKVAS